MTDENLPAGPANDNRGLPARAEAGRVDLHRGGTALVLEAQEERRDDDEIDLLAYWRILVKRRRLIASVLAGVVALALLATLTATPIYRATTVLQLDKDGIQVMQVEGIQPGDDREHVADSGFGRLITMET